MPWYNRTRIFAVSEITSHLPKTKLFEVLSLINLLKKFHRLENTAGEKMRHILDRMMDYRAQQAEKLKNNPEFTIGDVTTVNLTILSGGVQSNVVPPTLTALFDCRLAVDVDHYAFENMVSSRENIFLF